MVVVVVLAEAVAASTPASDSCKINVTADLCDYTNLDNNGYVHVCV